MTTTHDIRPMTVGEVLDRSFQVLRRHLGTLFVTALLGVAPMVLMYASIGVPYGGTMTETPSAGAGVMALVLLVLAMVGTVVSWAALTHQVGRAAEGGAVSFGDGVSRGLRTFFRVVGYWLSAYVMALVIMVPAVLAVVLVAGVLGAVLGNGLVSVLLTVVLGLVIGGAALLLWAPMGFLGMPAMILEGLGPIKAIKRAHALGKGARGRIMGTAVLAWILMMLPSLGMGFFLGLGAAVFDPTAAATATTTQYYLYQAATLLAAGLTTPFMVAAMVYSYYDRRVRREGLDVERASASIAQMA